MLEKRMYWYFENYFNLLISNELNSSLLDINSKIILASTNKIKGNLTGIIYIWIS